MEFPLFLYHETQLQFKWCCVEVSLGIRQKVLVKKNGLQITFLIPDKLGLKVLTQFLFFFLFLPYWGNTVKCLSIQLKLSYVLKLEMIWQKLNHATLLCLNLHIMRSVFIKTLKKNIWTIYDNFLVPTSSRLNLSNLYLTAQK